MEQDRANDPPHYRWCAIHPAEYIEANHLDFNEGNIVKYITRWRRKDGVKDLLKAKYYLERLIALTERETEGE